MTGFGSCDQPGCDNRAWYAVTGRGRTRRVCDLHLTAAQRDIGVPRETVRIDYGLLGDAGESR
jgi:hypothetical protein